MELVVCVSVIVVSTIVFVKMGRGGPRDAKGGVLYQIGDGDGVMLWHLSEEEGGRSAVYVRLRLSEDEVRTMYSWHLFPAKSNNMWWDKYYSRPSIVRTTPKSREDSKALPE